MTPAETAAHYDRIAAWIAGQTAADYGLAALRRAVRFTKGREAALDVGCGPTGRFLREFAAAGFRGVEGIDASAAMIALAAERAPGATLRHAEVTTWVPARHYDIITAWDSTFHLPLAAQEPVLRKLCAALAPGGVLLFTGGDGEESNEISGEMQGLRFDYSTLGTRGFLRALDAAGCIVRHVELDQWPEGHLVIIAQRPNAAPPPEP